MVSTPDLNFKEFILFVLLGMFVFIFITLGCFVYFKYFYRKKVIWSENCNCHIEEYEDI